MVTPDMVIDLAIRVLRERHREHLAALERAQGLPARTIEPFPDTAIDYLAGEGFRIRTDQPPVALVGIFGLVDQPQRLKDGYLANWSMNVELTVAGQTREDTMRRAYWYALAVVQCLLADLPRAADPIDALEWLDLDFTNGVGEEVQATLAQARLTFGVTVRQTLLPVVPPGSRPDDPYAPPPTWPLVQTVTANVIKEPLE